MPIDPKTVVWDDEAPQPQGIVWDDAPQPSRAVTPLKERLVQGFLDPIIGAAQLAEKIPGLPRARKFLTGSDTTMTDVVRHGVGNYKGQADYVAPEGIDWARMGGNVASPVSWVGGGASPLRAAYAGAVQGGLAPVGPDADFAAEKAKQAGLGAVGGAVLTKALSGLRGTPEAHALMARGVQPTVGQSLGGMANTFEQKAMSIPFVGDAIGYARNRALKDFERAALDVSTVAPLVGRAAPKTLDEANAFATSLYQDTVKHLKPTEKSFLGMVNSVTKSLDNPELLPDQRRILQGIVRERLVGFEDLKGEGIKRLDSELGHLARKYQGGAPSDRTLASEIYKVQGALRDGMITEDMPKEVAGKLAQANIVWKNMIPINQAASARADERIMPRALQRALARQQKTDPTRVTDPLVEPAVKVLSSTVPDSGTAGRLMLGVGGLGAGAGFGMLPQMAAVGVPAIVGASRPVQRAIMGNTATQRALQPHDATLAALLAAALRGQTNE